MTARTCKKPLWLKHQLRNLPNDFMCLTRPFLTRTVLTSYYLKHAASAVLVLDTCVQTMKLNRNFTSRRELLAVD